LKPQIVIQGQIIYQEGDEIDGFYFMIKGLASFSLPQLSNMIYAVIDPEKVIKFPNMKREVL
jgi:CRP-like cAMP-binding protein